MPSGSGARRSPPAAADKPQTRRPLPPPPPPRRRAGRVAASPASRAPAAAAPGPWGPLRLGLPPSRGAGAWPRATVPVELRDRAAGRGARRARGGGSHLARPSSPSQRRLLSRGAGPCPKNSKPPALWGFRGSPVRRSEWLPGHTTRPELGLGPNPSVTPWPSRPTCPPSGKS